jgi:threonine aldolase
MEAIVKDQPMLKIDLRSDTVSWPTLAMRIAMANAQVGDDVWGDDLTVQKLEKMSCDITGKEAAVFVPSGTQGNLIAMLVHCKAGDEAIVGHLSHSRLYEGGGMAAVGGIMPSILQVQPDGTLKLDEIQASIRPVDNHYPRSRIIVLENTANIAGGIPLTAAYTSQVAELAHKNGLLLHIDGARIFNAAVALGVSVKDLVKDADSVTFCLSKGLCAPTGSILCGTKEFITEAQRKRKMLGGGLRQVGILAAAGIVALETILPRLHEDHVRAKELANGIEALKAKGISLLSCNTNIVYFRLEPTCKVNPVELREQMANRGVLMAGADKTGRIRLVTHYWIQEDRVKTYLKNLSEILN